MGDLVKRFALGDLSGGELDGVLSHIETCALCSKDLEVLAGVASLARERPQAFLDAGPGEVLEKDRIPFFANIARQLRALLMPLPLPAKVLAPVAALLLIFVAYGSFDHPQGRYRPLADLSPAPYFPTTLRGGGESEDRFSRAMEDYRKGEYGEASRTLARFIEEVGYDEKAGLYLGVSTLLSGQVSDAIPHLARASLSTNTQIRQKSLWYLAQAFLLTEDPIAAQHALEEVVREGGDLSEKARAQLAKLEALEGESRESSE
jgi:hypothetical protein